jgi:hypothetical protein
VIIISISSRERRLSAASSPEWIKTLIEVVFLYKIGYDNFRILKIILKMMKHLMIGLVATGSLFFLNSPLHSAVGSTNLVGNLSKPQNLYAAASAKKADGTFQDATLETDYQAYLARKKKASKTARSRDDWEEARNYFLYDSPIGRGIAFNKKQSPSYPYNEVNLVTQKRLDSYVEGKEIVSRKATEFDDISETTFKQYVSELKNKYAVGTVIRSDKYPVIDGKKLGGSYILEVPDINQSALSKASFTSIAAASNVTIRYAAE